MAGGGLTAFAGRYRALAATGGDVGELEAPNLFFRGSCPFDTISGRDAVRDRLWTPLEAAFRGLRRRTDLLLSGSFDAGDWIATSGHFTGVLAREWLGIAPTDRLAIFRFGRFDRIARHEIVESYLLLDLPSIMLQAGCWPLADPLGPISRRLVPWGRMAWPPIAARDRQASPLLRP